MKKLRRLAAAALALSMTASLQVIPAAAEEPDELTIWSFWTIGDLYEDQGDLPYWKAVEEACNVNLTFIDSSNGSEALSLLIGTDDLPDIVIDYDGTLGGVQDLLSEESIVPLNDLMDAGFMPNFVSYLESDPEADKLIVNNEGLYAWAPMIRAVDAPLVFSGFMIRQDWLDELNLEVPTTLEEVETVLTAFKEEKNADAPLSFIYNNYGALVNTFGITEGMYVDGDGTVHYGFIEDAYLDFLTLFSRWMENGLMDPDGLTQNTDAYFAKIATDRVGMTWGYTGGTLGRIETIKADNPTMDFQPIAYPTLDADSIYNYDQSAYRVNNIGAVIADSCENKEAAARVIDYLYSEEGLMRGAYGEEGISYTIEDGEPQFTDYALHNPDGLSIERAVSVYAGCNNKPGVVLRNSFGALGGYALDVQKLSVVVWETPDAECKAMPPQSMTEDENEEYNSIMAEINTYTNEYKLKFILGTEPLENFPQFVETVKSMGIERAIEIRQAEYDRFLAR